jgi:hypothetical protein
MLAGVRQIFTLEHMRFAKDKTLSDTLLTVTDVLHPLNTLVIASGFLIADH